MLRLQLQSADRSRFIRLTANITLPEPVPNMSRRWTVIASGLLLSALALVMLYTGRTAFHSPLAIVVVAAIGLAAALLQFRLHGADAHPARASLWLNVLGLVCALAMLTQVAALAAVGFFAISSFLIFDRLRKRRI